VYVALFFALLLELVDTIGGKTELSAGDEVRLIVLLVG
jgi:hypothetical protein